MNAENTLTEQGRPTESFEPDQIWPLSFSRVASAIANYPMLAAGGWVNFGVMLIMFVLMGLDERVVAGANPWLKPVKYALALGLYSWTLAVVLSLVEDFDSLRATISKASGVLMLVMLAMVSIQSARGVASHYNVLESLDRWSFAVLGGASGLNTVFAAMAMALILTSARTGVAAGVLWGLRLGLVIFVAANFQGVQMILHQSHTVGAPDGTPGVPFLNWSTTRGDLRVAHVFGLFAVQALPVAGWLVSKARLSERNEGAVTIALGVLYAAFAFWVNRVAMSGRPLL